MRFSIEVRPVEPFEATPEAPWPTYVVDSDELRERGYERVVGLAVRVLAAQAELAHAEHEWIWGDPDE
jgi:hypothetical protein